ncbi:phosphoribosyltransferase-like protein [Paracidovorax avenae]|uniref:phosphoribosyltransferase-like protein n=1 Tax=Paracidovorax avenae TaxID=80867 RepID=UPI00126027B6|nr:hypothetical protein [Paracidovorax avenae]
MQFAPNSSNLLLTETGRTWLQRFKESDRPLIRQITESLSLVSLQEFERSLQRVIEGISEETEGVVALYAAREVPQVVGLGFRAGGSGLTSVAEGSDVGSEGRVANFVRQICRTKPQKLLRQLSIEDLKKKRVRHIIIVDDLIGSGKRIRDYLTELWRDSSIKSWHSYKLLRFTIVAYAGTPDGVRKVEKHPSKPSVRIHRYCPTLNGLPWPREHRRQAQRLCVEYANSFSLKGWKLGFGGSAALLVFEHSCPNNVPGIFWADSKDMSINWVPLFSGRATTSEIANVFPPELVTRTPVSILLSARKTRLAGAFAEVVNRPLAQETVIVLAMMGKGINRIDAISHATGLGAEETKALLEACIEQGLASPRRRLTDAGLAELAGLEAVVHLRTNPLPQLGEDSYYPRSLRGRIAG